MYGVVPSSVIGSVCLSEGMNRVAVVRALAAVNLRPLGLRENKKSLCGFSGVRCLFADGLKIRITQ